MSKSTTEPKNVIYGLYCVCDNCKDRGEWIRYVGQTTLGARSRFKSHLHASDGNYRPELKKLPLYRWINKHGKQNIRFKVLESFPSEESLDEAERKWIKDLGTFQNESGGLNLTPGGVGSRGYKHSEESKQKMRDNFRDRERRMKSSKPGETHPLATFTEQEVLDIKHRLWTGEGATKISRELRVPVHRIQQINTEDSWSHVPWPIGPREKPPYGSKLTRPQQREAARMKAAGLSFRKVAEHYGVSISVIVRAVRMVN